MANGYMPRADSAALSWMRSFSQRLAGQPGVYGVTAGEVASVGEAVAAFAAALTVASAPGTRTVVTVSAKDEARTVAESACRPIYARIKCATTISDEDKFRAGVRPINPARTRIGPPQDVPVLGLVDVTAHSHVLGYASEQSPSRRAKPFGATGLQVFRTLREGSQPQGESRYVGTFSRNPVRIALSAEDDLKMAMYTARWINRRGEVGPWSNPVMVRISCTVPNLGMKMAA